MSPGCHGMVSFLCVLSITKTCPLSKNKKNIGIFLLKIFIFDNFRNLCILHGQVFVMQIKALFLFFVKHPSQQFYAMSFHEQSHPYLGINQ